MPPPADEQAAMQQKMMKYMMIFMGSHVFQSGQRLVHLFHCVESLEIRASDDSCRKTAAPSGGNSGGGGAGGGGDFGETRGRRRSANARPQKEMTRIPLRRMTVALP